MTDRTSDISQTTVLGRARADFSRTLIIGNSGSGKSRLAARLSGALAAPAIDLDDIHWEPGGFQTARDAVISIDMTRLAAAEDGWIIEGVYGWLAREAAPRATALLWLDLPVEECFANLQRRGSRGD